MFSGSVRDGVKVSRVHAASSKGMAASRKRALVSAPPPAAALSVEDEVRNSIEMHKRSPVGEGFF